jgi:TolA-binding protein
MSVKAVPSTPAAIELSTSDLKKSDTIREKKREAKKKTDSGTAHAENAEKRSTTPVAGRYAAKVSQSQPDAISSQKLFEQAVKAYRQEDYRSALGLFDRFLADNPSSALAPDASLYKAECYMKLASQ